MAADFFAVPTVTFRLLFVLVILEHERRRLVHVAVTSIRPRPGLHNSFATPFRQRDIVVNTKSLHRVLTDYIAYYLHSRTHLALGKDTPVPRPVSPLSAGRIVATPEVGGLHHGYDRSAA